MKKNSKSLIFASLLAGSLLIPSASALADRDPPGSRQEREELRDDLRRLERLRQRRDQERRQGDWREAREYDAKMRDQQREIWQDRRELYDRDSYGYRYRWHRDYYNDWYRD